MNNKQAAAIVSLQTRLLALKLMPRTGWLQRGVVGAESVAEHTFGVATLALLVGDQIPDIDRGRLLAIALLHDLAEVLVGDLPHTARHFFGKEAKDKAEYQAMLELVADLANAEEYLTLWQEYTQRASREARLVKQLDRLEMLTQALAYEWAGSRVMDEFWVDIQDGWSDEFALVQEMAADLLRRRLNQPAAITLPTNGYRTPLFLNNGYSTEH